MRTGNQSKVSRSQTIVKIFMIRHAGPTAQLANGPGQQETLPPGSQTKLCVAVKKRRHLSGAPSVLA